MTLDDLGGHFSFYKSVTCKNLQIIIIIIKQEHD